MQISVDDVPMTHRVTLFLRGAVWTAVICLGVPILSGCSPLEPMVEPEVSDLQLTVDTLKTSVRDAQRTIAELRADLDARRQELADVQIARAQLEGRVREAERRLVEARHVIDLQREELAGSRSERERAARTGVLLQNQMKQLQKQLSRIGKQANETSRPAGATPASIPSIPRHVDISMPSSEANEHLKDISTPVVHAQGGRAAPLPKTGRMQVSVKPGDTLWSIAQRHHVSVNRLMALNQLPNNHIQAGQVLWLSDPPAAGDLEFDKPEVRLDPLK